MAGELRFLLWNVAFHNYALPLWLPRLRAAAGWPGVLLLNEVPLGLGGRVGRALGPGSRAASGPGLMVLGSGILRQAVVAGPGLGLETLGSFPIGRRGRRLLAARVTFGGRALTVAVAHLTNENPWRFGRRQAVRERELADLGRCLRSLAAGEPIVLGGDFNFVRAEGVEREHERAAARLAGELGLVDVAARGTAPGLAAATWPTAGTPTPGLAPQRFDLFYVSAALAGRVVEHAVLPWTLRGSGSDHRPVWLALNLDEGPA
jgi:hypothetical protein